MPWQIVSLEQLTEVLNEVYLTVTRDRFEPKVTPLMVKTDFMYEAQSRMLEAWKEWRVPMRQQRKWMRDIYDAFGIDYTLHRGIPLAKKGEDAV